MNRVNKGWRQLSIRVVAIWRRRNCDNILQFYSDLSVPIDTKKDQGRWQGVLTALDQLKSVAPMPTVAGSPTQ